MFRSTTIIRELVLNVAKVIFMLKPSVKLRRCMLFGDVAACHRVARLLSAVQDETVQKIQVPLKSDKNNGYFT